MKRQVIRFFVVLAVLVAILVSREIMLLPDGRLHAVFLDVGQGDAALITLPEGMQLLIDGGPDWSALEGIPNYMPFFDRSIDFVVLSHPNLDHLASLPEVLRRYRVGALLIAGSEYELGAYEAMFAHATAQDVPVIRLVAGKTIDLPQDAVLETLWPPARMPTGMNRDVNNESLVLRLTCKGKSLLFTGDIEKTVEDTLVAADVDIKADVLKVPHHGSKSSSSTGFLLAVSPQTAILSVGRDNTYGHPSPAVLQRLKAVGAAIRRTDREGDIRVSW
jgi:competence protein ComEC